MSSAALIAIGDELLSGVRQEKNCSFMAWHLHNKGWEVKRVEVIPDEESEIINLLSRWVGKVNLLILSGGLGPTHDDKTRYALAKFLECELKSDLLYDKILERVKNDPQRLARLERSRSTQSMIPERAFAVYNPTGSALGISFTRDGTRVIALPGVPMEYEAMTRQEFPEIFSPDNDDANYKWASVIILGFPEMSIVEKIPEVIHNKALHVSILPAFPQVELIIRGAPEIVDEAERITRERFYEHSLPKGCSSIAEAVLHEARARGKRIACSESCTGGLVGATLTEIPGSSEVFNGSAVTYSNNAKIKILGVENNTLEKFGAVSEQCAREMAKGAVEIYDVDFAVSITGIAGPDGGSMNKPVGTVWFGLASREESAAFMKVLPGNRSEIRTRAVRFALAELWRTIRNNNPKPAL